MLPTDHWTAQLIPDRSDPHERTVMAFPRRALRLWDHWRAEQGTTRQGLVALTLSTLAGFVAGLTATTGLRRSELAGLRWSDIDLGDDPNLRVRRARVVVGWDVRTGTPKSAWGLRRVPLIPEAVSSLRTWKRQQSAERLATEAWADATDWVFTTTDGAPVHPQAISDAFETRRDMFLAAHEDAPRLRFHDLRHTFATLTLQAGVAPHVVSRMLGHATVGFTLSVYADAMPEQTKDAAARMATVLGGQP